MMTINSRIDVRPGMNFAGHKTEVQNQSPVESPATRKPAAERSSTYIGMYEYDRMPLWRTAASGRRCNWAHRPGARRRRTRRQSA